MNIDKCDNSDFDLKLKYGQQFEDQLANLLLNGNELIEVKTDDLAWKYGNLVVEIARKKNGIIVSAGITITKSQWYFFKLCGKFCGKRIVGIETKDLKRLVLKYLKNGSTAWGGRDKKSFLVKIPLIEFITYNGIKE